MSESLERVRNARDELRRVCTLLSSPSPDAMAACGRALKGAVCELQVWLQETPPQQSEPELKTELAELRKSIRQAQHLIQAAAEYHSNWLQQICLMTGGYASDGRPAEIDAAARVALRA